MKFGLLGRKLSHSYSPQIHSYLHNHEYKLYEVEPENLDAFVKSNELDAFNVTIPYKKDIITYCNKLSETAKKIGAVNTVVREKDGTLTGYNTDYFGFLYMINSTNVDVKDKKAIILGSGGASLTCQCVLKDLGANVVVISRNSINNYDNLYKHFDAQIVVNATPVGMFPNINNSPVDLNDFKECKAVLDLIYNPAKTKLLKQADELNINNANGLSMLVAQAKKASEYFTNSTIDDSIIEKILKEFKI